MDNLGAHKPKRIRELIEGRGCELVYLPSYSPDYNLNRRSLRQDQEPAAQGSSQEQRGSDRSDSSGAILCDHCRRHPRLLSTCGIPSCRSTIVKRAVTVVCC